MTNRRTNGRTRTGAFAFVRFLPAANQFHAELRSGDGEGGVDDDDDDRIVFIAIDTAERRKRGRGREKGIPQPAPPSLLASVTESDLNN